MNIKLKNMLKAFSSAYEKFDKDIIVHCKEVAYIALEICNQLSIDEDIKKNLVIASYLHDISASKTNFFDKLRKFDTVEYLEHCLYGYVFFDKLIPSNNFSKYILYHHEDYKSKDIINNIEIPIESNILKLADDISLFKLLNNNVTIEKIYEYLNSNKESYNPIYFNIIMGPNGANILKRLLDNSYIDYIENYGDKTIVSKLGFIEFTECMAFILDFKCETTTIHSQTVSLFSVLLAKEFNLNEDDLFHVRIGSLLHDIGKIGIPDSILKKTTSLTREEFAIIKKHVEYTYEILSYLENEKILNIASNHHEKLNGKGYPRALSNLSLPERIVAVADIFAALNQKRSYKDEFSKEKTLKILLNCASNGEIDSDIVNKVIEKYDYFIDMNLKLYEDFNNKLDLLKSKYETLFFLNNSMTDIGIK